MIDLPHYLAVGAILLALGLIGFLTRRNVIVQFLSAELMLQGVALNFVAFSRQHGNLHGQVFALFIIVVAACEAGIGLAMFLMIYRRKRTLDVSVWERLREPGVEISPEVPQLPMNTFDDPLPRLPRPGAKPARERKHV